MKTCDEVRTHLGGYVLDGLETRESQWVADHLAHCADCAAEADSISDLPGVLALVTEAPEAPPAHLRERVLADARRRRPGRRRVVGLVAAVAAGVLLGVSGAVVASGGFENEQPEQAAWSTELEPGEGAAARGELGMVATGAGLRVELDLEGLDALPPRGVYEAWLRQPDREEPTSIGRFQPRDDGRAVVTFTAAGDFGDYEGFWVTAEPDAARPAHQGATVLWSETP